MNKTLNFKLDNYHAVGHADININGITVIAGINSCGKSTISRILSYYLTSMSQFEYHNSYRLINKINVFLSRLLRLGNPSISSVAREFYIEDKPQFFDIFPDYIDLFKDGILDVIILQIANGSEIQKRRIFSLFGIEYDDNEKINVVIDRVTSYLTRQFDEFSALYDELKDLNERRSISELKSNIFDNYDISDEVPSVTLVEDGLSLLLEEDVFQEPLYFRKAIYIDAALSPTFSNMRRVSSEDYLSYLMTTEVIKQDQKANELMLRLGKIINGKIALETSSAHFRSEFRYISNSGVDIKISEAASGIQSLAVIYRLLERGHLDEETLLLIDEPETHLHPQWVVEYARLLVLLNKKLNVKLLLASHSPDFVAAVEHFSRIYDLNDNTNYYQAKYDTDSGKYNFVSLTDGVADIFESFNIAMNRISGEE